MAANEISGAKYQRIKPTLGAPGSAVDAVGGAGTISSGVQRVNLATDDLAVLGVGLTTAAEATGDGSLIAILKRLRTLLTGRTRSDTYTGAANGTTVDVSTQGMSRWGIQVKGTGAAPSSWTVHFEVSLNGTNFQSFFTHGTADGDGTVKWGPAGDYPALYFRSRCSAVALGSATNIVATIVGMP